MHIRDRKMEECMKSMDRKRKGKVEYLRKCLRVREKMNWIGWNERKSKRDSDLDVHVLCRIRKNINCLGWRVRQHLTPSYAMQCLLRRCDRNGDWRWVLWAYHQPINILLYLLINSIFSFKKQIKILCFVFLRKNKITIIKNCMSHKIMYYYCKKNPVLFIYLYLIGFHQFFIYFIPRSSAFVREVSKIIQKKNL